MNTGTGAVFLRLLEGQGLEIMVWAVDLAGLRYALSLSPILTGSEQPDFVVVSDRCRWNGIRGSIRGRPFRPITVDLNGLLPWDASDLVVHCSKFGYAPSWSAALSRCGFR